MRILVVGGLAAGMAAAFVTGSSAVAAAPPVSRVATPPNNDHASPTPGATRSPPDFDAIMRVVDKMFPPQPDPDPARLLLARTSVQAMWPDGAYGHMMSGFMGNIFDGVMKMRPSDFAPLARKTGKNDTTPVVEGQSLHDQAAAKDPYFDQRMAAMRGVIEEEVGKMSAVIDPRMREGLARSMARRFDTRQLTDINAFFATPSGHALATQYMQLWFEPDTLRSMVGAFPQMIKLMPDMMQKFKAANDKFPKPKPAPAQGTKS